MRKPDFHLHSDFSHDSRMPREEAIEAALKCGITDLCFTEHIDLGTSNPAAQGIPDFAAMQESLLALRRKYPELHIGLGIEAGWNANGAARSAQLLAEQQLDFVLLSLHRLDNLSCAAPELLERYSHEALSRHYLETIYESLTDKRLEGLWDCAGHIGYIARRSDFADFTLCYDLFPHLFDDILRHVIRQGKGIEVNMSGVRQIGCTIPHPTVVQRYYELGGRIITVGSDGHKPDAVGQGIGLALDTLRRCGFTEFTVFENHTPHFLPLT